MSKRKKDLGVLILLLLPVYLLYWLFILLRKIFELKKPSPITWDEAKKLIPNDQYASVQIVGDGKVIVRPMKKPDPPIMHGPEASFDFNEHFRKYPDCVLYDLFNCTHSYHRRKSVTVEDCTDSKRAGWPLVLDRHIEDIRTRLKQGNEIGRGAFYVTGEQVRPGCNGCPNFLAGGYQKSFSGQQVEKLLELLPPICLWNFDVRIALR
jgi:hypothetical protein